MTSRNLRVLICDDHELIREGLKRILLESTDKIPALEGKTVSGGRLNLARAAQAMSAYGR